MNIKCIIPNFICSFFKMKKEIIFESNPDLSCNSYEVYKYMKENNLFSDYKLVWRVADTNKKYFDDAEVFSKKPGTLLEKIKYYFRCNRAMITISSNAPILKSRCSPKQLNIFLDHGSHLKEMKRNNKYCTIDCDYTISQSEFFWQYIKSEYNIDKSKIINCGIPRNDQFFKEKKSLSSLISNIDEFDKIICWVPTFRVADNGTRVDCTFDYPLGIPLLYDGDAIIELNDLLQQLNILLILKPHPVQDLSVLKKIDTSNIKILYTDDILSKNIHTNEFLLNCDAMITDYSGIYYDYLLLDRPVAITLDDFDTYSKEHGFVFENPLDILVGHHCYNKKDLFDFINNVANGIDEYATERNKIKQLTNTYSDGNSSKRFCESILKIIDEKTKNK